MGTFEIDGSYVPCCAYAFKDAHHKIEDMTVSEYLQTDYINAIKTNLENGIWDKGCYQCKNSEIAGNPSLRQNYNEYCTEPDGIIEAIDITINNACNMRCRMCSSVNSDKWATTLGVIEHNTNINSFSKLRSRTNMEQVNKIKYIGGEPFVTPEISEIFDFIEEKNYEVLFHFSTNLSLFPKQKYLDAMDKMQLLLPSVSIDGIGKVNSYIRQDSNWETTLKNLDKWVEFVHNKENMILYSNTVVQAYNFHNIKEVNHLVQRYGITPDISELVEPSYFTLNALPPNHIARYTDDFNINYIQDYKFNAELYEKLKQKTKWMDKLFDMKLEDSIPELYESINEYES